MFLRRLPLLLLPQASIASMATKVYSKFCQPECHKLVSQSSANPGRQYYSCPVSFENGGHGVMHWVDMVASPARRSNSNLSQAVEDTREKLILCQARLRLVTAKKEKHQGNANSLKLELAQEKMKTRCLMKCLKGIGIMFVVVCLLLLYCLV